MMKLFYTTRSPFARKVNALIHEANKKNEVELVPIDLWSPDNGLRKLNPLAKIPTLLLEDNSCIFDSPLICSYLDFKFRSNLFPSFATEEYWKVMWWQTLGDGILQAIVNNYIELELRPKDKQYIISIRRNEQAIKAGFEQINNRINEIKNLKFGIAHITIVTAIDYLNFRLPKFKINEKYPEVNNWYLEISKRPSLVDTYPKL